jgi:hypothetical protein
MFTSSSPGFHIEQRQQRRNSLDLICQCAPRALTLLYGPATDVAELSNKLLEQKTPCAQMLTPGNGVSVRRRMAVLATVLYQSFD